MFYFIHKLSSPIVNLSVNNCNKIKFNIKFKGMFLNILFYSKLAQVFT